MELMLSLLFGTIFIILLSICILNKILCKEHTIKESQFQYRWSELGRCYVAEHKTIEGLAVTGKTLKEATEKNKVCIDTYNKTIKDLTNLLNTLLPILA